MHGAHKEIKLPLSKAILYQNNTPYLAPEIVLLYKSTDIQREGYELDYNMAIDKMNTAQKLWLKDALNKMNPFGHQWISGCE